MYKDKKIFRDIGDLDLLGYWKEDFKKGRDCVIVCFKRQEDEMSMLSIMLYFVRLCKIFCVSE